MLRRATSSVVDARLGVALGATSVLRPQQQQPLLNQQLRFVNMNKNLELKLRQELQQQTYQSDYDFDKEAWSKNTKWTTMDCVLEPEITVPTYTSFNGIKRMVKQWIAKRKIMERRPDFCVEPELKNLYIKYKQTSNSIDKATLQLLPRLTTFGEAKRIEKQAMSRVTQKYNESSWKSLKMQKMEAPYELEITSFELVNIYIGQMTKEDWLQVTVKVTGRECFVDRKAEKEKREKLKREQLASLSKRQKQSLVDDDEKAPKEHDAETDGEKLSAKDKVRLQDEKEDEHLWKTFTEYPVFETRLTDGVKEANNKPFIVVTMMDETGARFGQDGNDAAQLRKSFGMSKKNSWFGGGT